MDKELFTADSTLFAADASRLSTVWYPCKKTPAVQGDTLRWVLDYARPYTAFEAYGKHVHRRFMNARTNEALIELVQEWGPLWNWMDSAEGDLPFSALRIERDKLTAWAVLIGSPGSLGAMQAVCCLLRSDSDLATDIGPASKTANFRAFLKGRISPEPSEQRPFDAELEDRILGASTQEAEGICKFMLRQFGTGLNPHGIEIEGSGKSTHSRAIYSFFNLTDAMSWMVWMDLFKERPIRFCARKGCSNIVIHEDARFKKFCIEKCEKLDRDRRYAKRLRRNRKRDGLTSRGEKYKRTLPRH